MWVETQVGELLFVTSFASAFNKEENTIYGRDNKGEYVDILGNYKTKEKCIEVIQKIKQRLSYIERLKIVGATDEDLIESDMIFEMPKDKEEFIDE